LRDGNGAERKSNVVSEVIAAKEQEGRATLKVKGEGKGDGILVWCLWEGAMESWLLNITMAFTI
jgi:hypothetical protein